MGETHFTQFLDSHTVTEGEDNGGDFSNNTFTRAGGLVVLPFDEDVQIAVIVLPVLCVLYTLLRNLWAGCCGASPTRVAGNRPSEQYSGELNDIQERAGGYTDEQRLRDREEELRIKGRASRVVLSHV